MKSITNHTEALWDHFNTCPDALHQAMLDAFHHLVATLQTALASSITHIFLLSAGLMVVAFGISFFMKEIPLKHHEGDDKATPSPGA